MNTQELNKDLVALCKKHGIKSCFLTGVLPSEALITIEANTGKPTMIIQALMTGIGEAMKKMGSTVFERDINNN